MQNIHQSAGLRPVSAGFQPGASIRSNDSPATLSPQDFSLSALGFNPARSGTDSRPPSNVPQDFGLSALGFNPARSSCRTTLQPPSVRRTSACQRWVSTRRVGKDSPPSNPCGHRDNSLSALGFNPAQPPKHSKAFRRFEKASQAGKQRHHPPTSPPLYH